MAIPVVGSDYDMKKEDGMKIVEMELSPDEDVLVILTADSQLYYIKISSTANMRVSYTIFTSRRYPWWDQITI